MTLRDDICDDWCNVPADMHEDHRLEHSGIVGNVELWGDDGLPGRLFLLLMRPYVAGVPTQDIRSCHTSVTLAIEDDEPLLSIPTAVARSLAAALLRAADRADTAGLRPVADLRG